MNKWIKPVVVSLVMAGSALGGDPGAHAPPAVPLPPQNGALLDAQLAVEPLNLAIAAQLAPVAAAADDAQAQRLRELAAAQNGDAQARIGNWVNRAGKKEKAAFLGVTTTSADAAMRDQLKVPRGIGLVIQTVQDDTPAAQAGLQQHDLITKLDDQWLVSAEQLGILIRMHKAGDEVTLTGLRQGQPLTIKAKLGEKEMVINDNDGTPMPALGDGLFKFQIPDINVPENLFQRFGNVVQDGDDSALIIRENDQMLKVSIKDNERRLVATDSNGQVLFDGPVETEEQRKALPADIAQQLEKYKEQFDAVKDTPPGQRKVRIIKDK